jgi:hypothetical protein
MSGMRHMIPCCSEPTADRERRRTVMLPEPVSKERFLAIFHEEGVDKEWAEIVYGRWIKAKEKQDEASVRQAAKDWAKDDGF